MVPSSAALAAARPPTVSRLSPAGINPPQPIPPHCCHHAVNEGLLRRGLAAYHLEHPLASSVLFLSDDGGPTIVLHQTPAGACEPAHRSQQGGAGAGGHAGGGSAEDGEQQERPVKRPRMLGVDGVGGTKDQSGQAAAPAGPCCSLDEAAARHLASRAWLVRPKLGRWAVSTAVLAAV